MLMAFWPFVVVICQFASLPVCQFASLPVCQFAGLQVFKKVFLPRGFFLNGDFQQKA
jgi:hypothetical protein